MSKTSMKLRDRFLAALLSVLMIVAMIPVTTSQAFAATSEYPNHYTVTVTDGENPVEGAQVALASAVPEFVLNLQATTDANGIAAFDATALEEAFSNSSYDGTPSITITVQKDGYEQETQTWTLLKDNITDNVLITIDKVVVQQATVSVNITGAENATVEIDGVVQNSKTVDVGTEVAVKITPAAGSYIKTLTVGGETVTVTKGEAYSGTVTVNANVAIVATVVKEFTVSAPAVEGGSITLNGGSGASVTVDEKTKVTVGVAADAGYQISSVAIGGETQTLESDTTFNKEITVTKDTEIVVVFAKVYTITVTHNNNGTVVTTPATAGGSVTVVKDSTVKITADPDDNYRISEVKINGVADGTITGANYGTEDKYVKELTADKDYAVVITFAPNRYNVTAADTENGTVSIESNLVDHNGSTKVTLAPEAGYAIESVKVNGVDAEVTTPDDTTAYFLIEGIVEDKNVVVTFKKTATADMNSVSFNTGDSLRPNLNVFAKDATVTFKTTKTGIKVYDTNDKLVGGAWNKNSVAITKTTSIGKISLYYKADGEWAPAWHDVTVVSKNNPLNIVIDVDCADIDITPVSPNAHGYYNSDVSVAIATEDKGNYSGIGSVEYWIMNGKDETKRETLYNHETGAPIENKYNGNIIVDAVANNSDNVVVNVKVTDRAGNAETKTVTLKINSTKPSVSVAIDGTLHAEATAGKYNANRTATVTYIDRATTFNEVAAMDGIVISAKDAGGRDVVISKAAMIKWNHSGDTHTATISFTADANYEWNVSYTNKADLSDDAIEATGDSWDKFAVDTETPTAEIVLDNKTWNDLISILTFGIFKKDYSVTATATGSDATTDIYDILYYKSNETSALERVQLEQAFKDGKFSKNTVTVGADERFAVYARITDLAGNTKYISTNGVIYDDSESAINIAPPLPNMHGYYNKDIVIPVSVSDVANVDTAYSGIKSITYVVEKDGQKTQEGTLYTFDIENPTYDQLKADWSGNITVDAKKNNHDNVKVTVKVIDNAGNLKEQSVVLAINTDKPTSTIDFSDTGKVVEGHAYYSAARTATITIIDRATSFDKAVATNGITFSAVDVKGDPVALSGDDVVISDWTSSGDQHTATVTFNKDGKYTWAFAYTNKADNEMTDIKTEASDYTYSFTVDKTDPTGTITVNTNTWDILLNVLTFGLYSNVKADITATADDATSPYIIEYFETSNPIAMTAEDLDKENFRSYNDYSIDNDKQFVVYLKITDYASNYTYISSDGYIVDKIASNITLTPSAANGFYDAIANADGQYGLYNKDSNVTVDIKIEDAEPYSGIKTVDYWVENNNVKTQEGNLFAFNIGAPAQKDLVDEWNGTITVDKAINNSCNVVVYVKTVDNAGNEKINSVKLDIDITVPVIDVKFDNNKDNNGNTYFDAQRTATVVITERKHHFDATAATEGIIINAVDAKGNKVEAAYSISDWKTEDNTQTPDAATHTATIFFEKDANYTWSITYTDKAGNANSGVNQEEGTVAAFDFTVDTTDPTGTVKATSAEGRETEWKALRDALTFGFWSKEKITITGTSDDVTSAPIAAVEYYKVKATAANDGTVALTAAELDNATWTKFESLEITEDEQFTVYIKITDLAGNYTYISTNGLIVDHTAPMEETIAPEITVEPQQPINGLYNGDVKVDIKVVDPLTGGTYSGLKTITYKVLNMGVETQTGTLYAFGNADPKQSELLQTWTGEITVDSKLNNSNDVAIVIYAEDNSLNSSDDEVAIKIDITDPAIDVSYDNNSADNAKYFKDNRTATIVVTERNFKSEDVKVTITNTDGVIPTIGEWTKTEGTGNLDDTKWTTTVTYNADGDYTFDIAYTDLADNACAGAQYGDSVAPTEFTLDKTLPVASVSYDNNDAKNDKYFAAPRTATIVVTEHNFDVNRVVFAQTAALNGTNITIPAASWVNNGDVHTATIVFDKDGDYTFDVTVKDMAANDSEAASYGDSVAGKDFVVDQNIDKPIIGGVKNGGAYKEDVIPTISFNDVNYDSYEVKLVRTRKDEKEDVTDKFIKGVNEDAQNISGSFDTFKKEVENDGIYTLTVKVKDKAGNESDDEYTFTVNRFGSVYKYNKKLSDLIAEGGQYVQSVDDDLVITEYNADKLLEGSLKILITRDGETIEPVIDPKPVINDTVKAGDSGWYEYVYTIKKATFAKDGVYKISIASEYGTDDSANNESTSVPKNSTMEDGSAIEDSMTFTVDSVAPEIRNIVNLDNAVADRENIIDEQLNVKYTIVDVGGLKTIEIIVDGKVIQTISGEEIAENAYNFTGDFNLKERPEAYTVQIKVTDLAGNVTNTDSDEFLKAHSKDNKESTYVFSKVVTVSRNFFVRWYAQPGLFWGSIAGVIVLVGAIWFLLAAKKKKKEDDE